MSTVAVQRARNSNIDPQARWRGDFEAAYIPRARKHYDGNRVKFQEDEALRPEPQRVSFEPGWRAAPRESSLERAILRISALLLIIGAVGCFWLLYTLFQMPSDGPSSRVVAQAPARANAPVVVSSGKGDFLAVSTHLRADRQAAAPAPAKKDIAADRNARTRGVAAAAVVADAAPSALIARAWNEFQPVAPGGDKVAKTDVSKADVSKADVSKADVRAKTAPLAAGQMRLASVESRPVPQRPAAPEGLSVPAARPALLEGPPPQTRLAALDSPPVQVGRPRAAPEELLPRLPTNTEEKTELVGFDTSPFPYNGESGRHHTVFRGRTASETDTYGTYSDPRVLLHIPQGFDPSRPAVMVVFFHGHRASLAQDVRDRQKVPAQITASGSNAVLVAPQFAVNAADSNAGKFYEQGGFRRFLDESAKQLARLHGDPRSAQAFANMPIVIVAYSGGYGPLLSVLSRGEVKPSRIHGIVMLDALYSGMDRFAEWIANNRSAFYISSYTPHTRGRNVELEDMLAARSVPYGSELRREHLQGMVTFLPAGAISHRDFVNHAWGDYPIADVLMRMDELDHNLEVAHKPTPPAATASVAPRD